MQKRSSSVFVELKLSWGKFRLDRLEHTPMLLYSTSRTQRDGLLVRPHTVTGLRILAVDEDRLSSHSFELLLAKRASISEFRTSQRTG